MFSWRNKKKYLLFSWRKHQSSYRSVCAVTWVNTGFLYTEQPGQTERLPGCTGWSLALVWRYVFSYCSSYFSWWPMKNIDTFPLVKATYPQLHWWSSLLFLPLPLSGLIQMTNWWYLFYFSQKTGSDISCKLSPLETICMKCQNLFSGEK